MTALQIFRGENPDPTHTDDENGRESIAGDAAHQCPRMRSWEVAAQVAIDGVRRTANRAPAGESVQAREEVARQLQEATSYLDMPASIRTWWLGTRLQGTWSYIHNAQVAVIELMDDAQLDAYVPHVLALSTKYLKENDPERTAISERLGPEAKRMALTQALQSAHERMADEYYRLRRFQISIAVASVLILLLVGVLVLLGALRPELVPLCFPDPNAPGANAIGVCPSGAGSQPTSADVAVVVLFGLLGAVLTGVRFVAQRSVASSVPMSTTRSFQALFKAAVGTLAAVLGLLFLRAGVVPGFTQVDTQSQILAYAVVFGAAQEFITRLIDQRSNTLLAGATSNDKGRGVRS